MNLTFPMFNLSPSNLSLSTSLSSSFIKYRLPYDIKEFFELRFRFIAHQFDQKSSLLMFMGEMYALSSSTGYSSFNNELMASTSTSVSPTSSTATSSRNSLVRDFITLVYDKKYLVLRMNLGQGKFLFLYSFSLLHIFLKLRRKIITSTNRTEHY